MPVPSTSGDSEVIAVRGVGINIGFVYIYVYINFIIIIFVKEVLAFFSNSWLPALFSFSSPLGRERG